MPTPRGDQSTKEVSFPNQVAEEQSDGLANGVSPESRRRSRFLLPLLAVFFLVVFAGASASLYLLLSAKFGRNPDQAKQSRRVGDTTAKRVVRPAMVEANAFASYETTQVNVSPNVPSYTVGRDLSNVVNADQFSFLSDKAKEMLAKNAFVVLPGGYKEFFHIYENNRYNYIPSFITTDSMLHSYHLVFDFLLRRLEEEKLAAELSRLSGGMLNESLRQYASLKGTDWENASKRVVGFFAVANKILDPSTETPAVVANEVNQELALMAEHEGIKESPVMNIGREEGVVVGSPQGRLSLNALKEDYSQYIPRGHYDKTEQLRSYFKAMMWYGRLTFRLRSDDEVKSALLITLALENGDNQERWDRIYEPVNFFVGKSDDITYYQFKDLLAKIYGARADLSTVRTGGGEKLDAFIKEAKALEPPQINSMPIFEASIQADRQSEIMGFRFMGQRFTIDASIFQRLLYREVGDKTTSCQEFDPAKTGCPSGARCLPKGLDIPATMGSEEAKRILEEAGETEYACYSENMTGMREYLSGLDEAVWTQNLYWGWLYQLRPLLSEATAGYPTFMRNRAWLRKSLNTFLGSWTELKHDTILYAKQAYAELGGGPPPEEADDRGYVEPNPYVYARLAALLKMTREGLDSRGLLVAGMKESLTRMEKLALSLKTIAEKELNNEKLTDEEYELVRSYGGQLEHIWLDVNKDEEEFKANGASRYLDDNPASLVADVATDPNGFVLEEGIGGIGEIYVVVPVGDSLRLAKGAVYSYYEFTWPMKDRLTDGKWRDLLYSEDAPALPSWTDLFVCRRF